MKVANSLKTSSNKLPKLEVNEKTTINLYSHNRIYYTVVESWKNDPIIGGGYKSYRVKCKAVLLY